jgi:formylglycine-generating enzyme required for sulfatase activity
MKSPLSLAQPQDAEPNRSPKLDALDPDPVAVAGADALALEEGKSTWAALQATGADPFEAIASASQGDFAVSARLWLEALRLVEIPAGVFQMGSDSKRRSDELPTHNVAIPKAFRMGAVPITKEAWKVLMDTEPDAAWGGEIVHESSLPVASVSWVDTQAFLERLNEVTAGARPDGQVFRLPSEAEWEYACRAGTSMEFSFGNGVEGMDGNGWCDGNSGGHRHPVGILSSNSWGLYDLHGNVWEWCQDLWHKDYEGAPADGAAWQEGGKPPRRVMRGGSYFDPAWRSGAAFRRNMDENLQRAGVGLRVVLGTPHWRN